MSKPAKIALDGLAVKRARMSLGFTQIEASDLLRIKHSRYVAIEINAYKVTIGELHAICNIFGLVSEDIITKPSM